MKKVVLIIACAIPSAAIAQSAVKYDPFEYFLAFFIALIVILVLREVFTWYWKVNIIVKNQSEQIKQQIETNNLLKEQIDLLRTQIEMKIDAVNNEKR